MKVQFRYSHWGWLSNSVLGHSPIRMSTFVHHPWWSLHCPRNYNGIIRHYPMISQHLWASWERVLGKTGCPSWCYAYYPECERLYHSRLYWCTDSILDYRVLSFLQLLEDWTWLWAQLKHSCTDTISFCHEGCGDRSVFNLPVVTFFTETVAHGILLLSRIYLCFMQTG